MATVTGTLSDFGLDSLSSYSPEIVFTPSGPAVSGSALLATKPRVAIPLPSGAFTTGLAPTDDLRPDVWYTISVRWLDSTGGYIGADFPEWKLYVPTRGGNIADLLGIPSNPSQVWVGETPPPNPSPGTWWLNPSTGALTEWSN